MKKRNAEPTKDQVHADQRDKHGDKESTKRHVYIEPGAQIDLVEDLKNEYKTANTDSNTRNDKQLFWAKVSAGLIFVYAGLTFWQGCSTQRAADAAKHSAETTREAMILDQRPWVYADNVELPLEPQLNVPFFFHTWMSNAGKTPATDVLITEQTKWWNSEPDFPDFSNMPEPTPAQLVMPGIDKYEANSTPVMMDKFPYIGAYEQTRESRLYLLMKISYCDGFGNRYWTTMCISHGYGTKPKDMRYCAHGNAVGKDTNYKSCSK
jgi:hypothetical protein